MKAVYEDAGKIFAELVEIDSPSLKEKKMAEHIREMFRRLGVELTEDDSAEVTGSDAGNLYGCVKGGKEGKPILLSAHMDTVMPVYGKKAIFGANGEVRSDGTTVLGADDLAGVTAIYEAVKYLRENQITHCDIELLFTTGEEIYGKGAKAFDYGRLNADRAYVLDLSGRIGDAAYAAPSILSFTACMEGKAAHAGFCPEEGVNAIAAASRVIASLRQGRIDEETTANIGMISGGRGINIVSPECVVRGEVRSLKHEKAVEFLREYREAFEKAAEESGGRLYWEESVDIRAYETGLDSQTVTAYRKAAEKAGIEARMVKTFGGSDENVYFQYGIEGIVMATSMNCVHSCREYTNIHEIVSVTEILIHLLTGENE
ncbi:MAG: M20/M25/M40 family metallo-hydrolase [Lachnospiraceae bacterium]|nr:M20/M25/M40 family metallo-hydrolase [Lachnospiraceae bacterium]